MKATNIIIVLASVLAATAFSLEKPRSVNRARLVSKNYIQKKAPMMSESSTALFTAVAAANNNAASAPAQEKNGGFLSAIWNENTKLAVYLIVWYLGNVYYNIYNKKACNALGKNLHGHANAHW